MPPRHGILHALFARASKLFNRRPSRDTSVNRAEFARACRDLAYWSASDAGLSGPIEVFDGSRLDGAADGMLTIRMTLADTLQRRSPGDAANIILRSLDDLRVLVLLEIDGRRFTYAAPNANPGVRALCQNFTNRTETAG